MGFVADEVALEQVLFKYFGFPSSALFIYFFSFRISSFFFSLFPSLFVPFFLRSTMQLSQCESCHGLAAGSFIPFSICNTLWH
jgi:hypothetical protein